MPRIRKIEIENFRGIKKLCWLPNEGVNCLIGPGDSGKTTIIDAIRLCLSAHRNLRMTDVDFYQLNVEDPIQITLTIGALNDALKNMNLYGIFLRGFVKETGEVEDEPEVDCETVLTLHFRVKDDLEPSWMLFSERAVGQGIDRYLSWPDRRDLVPTWIDASSTGLHLGWNRGSVLNHLSKERTVASAAIVKAARDARATFGHEAKEQLSGALRDVGEVARRLNIPVGSEVKAMLEAHSVSTSTGAISLHDEDGVPLRGLGMGSARLLIAGLQTKIAETSSIILVDELEHGLEPHRVITLLDTLCVKKENPSLQMFLTTHSSTALRELDGSQLCTVRRYEACHKVLVAGTASLVQGTIRRYPHAFLAPSVIVCEGASEVGFLRGLDRFYEEEGIYAEQGGIPLAARGVALIDAKGGMPDKWYQRAEVFRRLGHRIAVFRDDDRRPSKGIEKEFEEKGGKVFTWQCKRCLEEELFFSLSDEAIGQIIDCAIELHGEIRINNDIQAKAQAGETLESIASLNQYGEEERSLLAAAANHQRNDQGGWFKQLGRMRKVAREIIGPDLPNAEGGFRDTVIGIFEWTDNVES